MRNIFLFFAASVCCIVSCKQKSNPLSPDEVTGIIKKFDDNWKKKNTAGVDSVLATSYTYFTQSGSTFSRDSILQTASSPEYQLQESSREIISTQMEGNTAVVNTKWTGKGLYRGQPFADTQRCSVTIIKDKDTVRIMAEHCTLMK